ncbi:hypothetical protein [Qipengyuania flava]|uniref:hypothetical protein n=1 Tax=Qipengyuania flava TaxID=192812 RepID=UPI001C63A509|nr:hypothetical protein [Qipengyuania flava]QYJ06935.1 hypothetical protein KUV82_12965 [Qipengyuania flava]
MGGGIDQSQLDRLFTAALEAAIARIEKDRTFFPLIFELRETGAVHNVAVLETEAIEGAQSVLDRFAALLRPRAAEGTIRAAAIALHRADDKAIEIRLRAANYSSDIRVPFELETRGLIRKQRAVTLGEFAAREAENDIF